MLLCLCLLLVSVLVFVWGFWGGPFHKRQFMSEENEILNTWEFSEIYEGLWLGLQLAIYFKLKPGPPYCESSSG